jgi:hypothetical protein
MNNTNLLNQNLSQLDSQAIRSQIQGLIESMAPNTNASKLSSASVI